MTLVDCVRCHSYREFRTWTAWFASQQNEPSRADFYAMAIAAEVRRANVKKPANVHLGDFQIKFDFTRAPANREPTYSIEASKQVWFAATGYKSDGR